MVKYYLVDYKNQQRLILATYNNKDNSRFLELLCKPKRLMSEDEKFELCNYSCLLNYHLDFLVAAEYMKIYQKYLRHETTIDEFHTSISNMISLNKQQSDYLKQTRNLLTPHSKSFEFSAKNYSIFEDCENLRDYDSFELTSFDVPEEDFRYSVQQTYNKLKEILEE